MNKKYIRRPFKNRRLTPADADWVIDEWKKLELKYLDDGFSAREAHLMISREYRCSRRLVHYHLHKAYDRNRVKRKIIPYSVLKKNPDAYNRSKKRHKEYARFARHPEEYLKAVFNNSKEQHLTLEDISLKLYNLYNFLPRIRTLESISDKLAEKYGQPILKESPETNPKKYEYFLD